MTGMRARCIAPRKDRGGEAGDLLSLSEPGGGAALGVWEGGQGGVADKVQRDLRELNLPDVLA